MDELKKFHYDIEELESTEQAMMLRGRLQDGLKYIKELIAELDLELMRIMREQDIQSFEWGIDELRKKIWVGKKKTEKITNLAKLRQMLFSEDEAEREMSRAAMSSGQSAWKVAKVKELADTLGLDLVQTTYSDKLEIKEVPVNLLKKGDSNG